MSLPEQWYKPLVDAIPLRRSVRSYLPDPIPEELPGLIEQFNINLSAPFKNDAKIELFQAEPGKKLYNNSINPINNLAIISQTDLVSISKAGFIGELLMLYAVSNGLDTCWFGHYKLSEVGKYVAGFSAAERIKESAMGYGYGNHIDVGERIICCIPFGYKNEGSKRLKDYFAGKIGDKRKRLFDLLENPELVEKIPTDIAEVLELAKLAPSAANSQMWRFGFSSGFRIITISKPMGYRHFKWEHPDVDIGVCAAHVWLGLLSKGYDPIVEVRKDADRAFWTFFNYK